MIDTILILLATSLILVGIARRLGLSPIIGFILVGILVGPHGMEVIPDSLAIHQMAEFGIVFLMFTIGLEFSLSRLLVDRFRVLVLGGLQVLLTASVFAGLALTQVLSPVAAVTVGVALAMSSTAIVSRMLLEGNEINSEFGRTAVCILLFQDLATILFLLVLPHAGSGDPAANLGPIALSLAKGVLVFFVLLLAGRRWLRPLFGVIARLHSPELFMLTVLLISVGAAAFSQVMGLSLALGGFMAGTLVGETEFRHQVESDIRPFQDVLLGLFFITVGMLMDLDAFTRLWPFILLVSAVLILIKAGLVYGLVRITGNTAALAIRSGITLAHGGEFSLLILFLALRMQLLPGQTGQVALSAVLLSMALAPFLIRYSQKLTRTLAGVRRTGAQQELTGDIESGARDLDAHVILCGYGRVGQNIAWYLDAEKVEYVVLDLDLHWLHRPGETHERITYGDATRRDNLLAAGLERAQAVVITFTDVRSSLKTLSHVHGLRPDITVLVRTIDEEYLDDLLDAGATEVIPDTLETSLAMATHVLTLLGVPVSRIEERSDRIRADRYRLLRGLFHVHPQEDRQDRLRILRLPTGAHAVGRRLSELDLENRGITVTAVRRHGIRGADPDPEMRLAAGDALIMHGTPEDLERAERYLFAKDDDD